MAKINGHYLLVEEETPGYEVEITDHPVEKGIDVSDHVQRKARTLSLTGFIVGGNASQMRAMLIAAMENGTQMKYIGRTEFTGLINSFTPKHDHTVANGFSFSMTLKELRTAKTSYVGSLPAPIRTQAAPIVNSGTKQSKAKNATATTIKGGTTKPDAVQKVKFKAGSPWAEG